MNKKYLNLIYLLFFIIVAILQGFSESSGDLSTYIPFLLHENNNNLFKNDLLIQTISDHPVYIWKVLAPLLDFVSVKILFSFLWILMISFLAISLKMFYCQIFESEKGWIYFLLPISTVSTSAAMGMWGLNPYGYFHPGALAFSFAIFSYVFALREKWMISGFIVGFIFLFHPFTAIYSSLFFFVKLLLDFKGSENKSKLIAGTVILLLISSPSWFPHFQHIFASQDYNFDYFVWKEFVYSRMKHSFFILLWVPERFIYLFLSLAGIFYFRKEEAFARVLPIIISVISALSIMILAELFDIKFLLQLQLARNSFVIFILLCAFAAHRIQQINKNNFKLIDLIWIFAIYFHIVSLGVSKSPEPYKLILLVLPFLSLFIIYFFRKSSNTHKIFLISSLVLICVTVGYRIDYTFAKNGNIIDNSLSENNPWREIQEWCRNNLSENETIMTPIYIEGFRAFSHRSIFGSIKDGAPHNYSKRTFMTYWSRMKSLGIELPLNSREIPDLYHEYAEKSALENNIRYVIYDKNIKSPPVEALHSNERFAIFLLDSE